MSRIKFQIRVWAIPEIKFAIAINPKVGCTSIKQALIGKFGRESMSESLHSWERVPEGFTQIMPVRSPWERLRSFYSHNLQLGKRVEQYKRLGLRKEMNFRSFVCQACEMSDEETDRHLISQHLLYESPKWNGLPTIERFENFPAWWGKYNLPPLPHVQKSITAKPPWTKDIVEMIGKRYAHDIAIFQYEAPKL